MQNVKEVKNLKKLILTILIIFLTVTAGLSIVSAQNETDEYLRTVSEESERIGQEVKSKENGHVNISFDDGYNGYCIDHGKTEAKEGDAFTVQNTSSARHNVNDEDVGNYLKTFFVNHYDEAMKNPQLTQHYIWMFTDQFDSRYVNKTIVENVRTAASNAFIPDHGASILINNNTTRVLFNFEVLLKDNNAFQSFFAYKLTYQNVTQNNTANETQDNATNNTGNSTNPINETVNNITLPERIDNAKDHAVNMIEKEKSLNPKNQENEKSAPLAKHATGYSLIVAVLVILILAGVLVSRYRRD